MAWRPGSEQAAIAAVVLNMDGQDIQDGNPDPILFILYINVKQTVPGCNDVRAVLSCNFMAFSTQIAQHHHGHHAAAVCRVCPE